MGAKVNATQNGGWSALHEAASRGDIELIRLLLNWGADKFAKSDDGRSPLEIAVQDNRAEIIAMFQSR
jgi:ankyrin repeat protein